MEIKIIDIKIYVLIIILLTLIFSLFGMANKIINPCYVCSKNNYSLQNCFEENLKIQNQKNFFNYSSSGNSTPDFNATASIRLIK